MTLPEGVEAKLSDIVADSRNRIYETATTQSTRESDGADIITIEMKQADGGDDGIGYSAPLDPTYKKFLIDIDGYNRVMYLVSRRTGAVGDDWHGVIWTFANKLTEMQGGPATIDD